MADVEACLSHVGSAFADYVGRRGLGAGGADVLVQVCVPVWGGLGAGAEVFCLAAFQDSAVQ